MSETDPEELPNEMRLAFKKAMLKRMLKFLKQRGEAKGIESFTALARRAVDEFLKKHGIE